MKGHKCLVTCLHRLSKREHLVRFVRLGELFLVSDLNASYVKAASLFKWVDKKVVRAEKASNSWNKNYVLLCFGEM